MFPAGYWGVEYWGPDYWPPQLEIIDETTPSGGIGSLKGVGGFEKARKKRLIIAALLHEAGLL